MKQIRRQQVAVLAGIIACCAIASRFLPTQPGPAGSDRVLRLGINESPPYSTLGPDGIPRGFTVDVIREAARRAGLKVQIIPAPEGPDRALPEGRVDIWPLLTKLPERNKILFTDPWMRTSYVLLVRKGGEIANVEDAAGHTIAVGNLPVHIRLAQKAFARSTLASVPMSSQLDGVCSGTVDAAMIGKKEMLALLLHRSPECETANLQVVPIREANYQMAIGANANVFAQAKQLRRAIDEMSADSTLNRLHWEWLSDSDDETAIVNELQRVKRKSAALYWSILFLAGLVSLLAWLIYRKAAAERAARAASEFTSAVLDGAGGLVVITDRHGSIVRFNRACQDATGKSFREVHGRAVWELFVPPEEQAAAELLHSSLVAGRSLASDEHHWQTCFGDRLYSWSYSTLKDSSGATEYVINNGVDISDREERAQRLRIEASSDPLTGLLNRRGLAAELDKAISEARKGAELWLGVADLDSFKQINDIYGHAAGDDVLVAFAQILVDVCSEQGAVGRLGGDEFCFLLKTQNPDILILRLRQSLNQREFHPPKGGTFRIAASFGGAKWTNTMRSSADLFRAADESLYCTKRTSRARRGQSTLPNQVRQTTSARN